MEPIAHIRSDFPTKFGVPRQAGLVEQLRATVVFQPPYRVPEALRGIEGFSHLWLIWEFSQNRRLGVFATRSPFRPNPIGLSCVRLEGVEPDTPDGPVLHISGADMVDGTPIFDVKPYVPYADCRPEAVGGFAGTAPERVLEVNIPPELLAQVPENRREALAGVLAQDPRPSYQNDLQRVYGFRFAGLEVRFTVRDGALVVTDIAKG